MHRSPLCALMLCAALAACSTRDDSRSTDVLSQDSTLAARLDGGRDAGTTTLPDTCRAIVATARPAVVNRPRADTLTRQAYDAEILGNVAEARTLLRRASDLDGTNKATEYHLGRTSEALGERGAAIAAYCRYLTLTPTATESAEARQRVASLSQATTGGASDSAATRGSARVATTGSEKSRPVTTTPVTTQRATPQRATPQRETVSRVSTRRARERAAGEARVVSRAANTATSTATSPTTITSSAGSVDSTSSAGDVMVTSTREPVVDQPATDSRTASRGPSRTQSAGIGAAAGAIIGAAAGRSVKGAVIGAAAGGILGGAMGGRR